MTTNSPKSILRVAPKAYEYTKAVLDFGFHNANSIGMTGRRFTQHRQKPAKEGGKENDSS